MGNYRCELPSLPTSDVTLDKLFESSLLQRQRLKAKANQQLAEWMGVH
ncbi:hypothetical protein [Vreelandella massiliensis]|nr:hypothetical protein [Halomonas massiliensis]